MEQKYQRMSDELQMQAAGMIAKIVFKAIWKKTKLWFKKKSS